GGGGEGRGQAGGGHCGDGRARGQGRRKGRDQEREGQNRQEAGEGKQGREAEGGGRGRATEACEEDGSQESRRKTQIGDQDRVNQQGARPRCDRRQDLGGKAGGRQQDAREEERRQGTRMKPRERVFPSTDAIVAFIRAHPGKVGTKEIAREFGLKNADRAELKRILRELADR